MNIDDILKNYFDPMARANSLEFPKNPNKVQPVPKPESSNPHTEDYSQFRSNSNPQKERRIYRIIPDGKIINGYPTDIVEEMPKGYLIDFEA